MRILLTNDDSHDSPLFLLAISILKDFGDLTGAAQVLKTTRVGNVSRSGFSQQRDHGAREVVRAAGEFVVDVPTNGKAAITDLDTPEAWAAWRAR